MRPLAEFCYKRRRLVVVAWIVMFAAILVLCLPFRQVPDGLQAARLGEPAGAGLVEGPRRFVRTGFSGQFVFKSDQGIQTPAVRQAMEKFFADVQSQSRASRSSVLTTRRTPIRSVPTARSPTRSLTCQRPRAAPVRRRCQGLRVALEPGRPCRAFRSTLVATSSRLRLPASEVIGVVAAVIILLLAFGSVLAMWLPIVTALFGIGCGLR